MQLTVEQAAARLGKSRRQISYLIKIGRLPARKFSGVWIIDSENLLLTEGQAGALERRERQLRSAVEEALEIPEKSDRAPRYSVRDLKAFQVALPLYRSGAERLGAEHPAVAALRDVLEHLARGCHRFERSDKAAAYREARDAASLAVCQLLLVGGAEADGLVTAIEQELMSALAGLLRRVDRRQPR